MSWLSAAFRQESKEKNKRKAEQAKKRKAEEAERQQAHEGPDFPAADPAPTEPASSDYGKRPVRVLGHSLQRKAHPPGSLMQAVLLSMCGAAVKRQAEVGQDRISCGAWAACGLCTLRTSRQPWE